MIRVAAAPARGTRASNPYNALLADALERHGAEVTEYSLAGLVRRRPDIVHLHWPELLFLSTHRPLEALARIAAFDTAIAAARRSGTRLVWTLHNDAAHEERSTPAVRAALDRMLARRLDGVVALTEVGAEAARRRFGDELPVVVTPHGHYRDAYPLEVSRAAARAQLGVPPEVTLLVAVGQVRGYKQLDVLARAARAVPDPALRVSIAGRPTPETEAALRDAAGDDPRILLDLQHLDDARMAAWLRAADAVVLPYRRILNSGAAILALSADRPVIVPGIGAMPELRAAVGPEWVRCYDGDLTRPVLLEALDWLRGPRDARPDLAAFEWNAIAAATVSGYRALLDAPRRTGFQLVSIA